MGNIEQHGIDLSESVENEWLCLEILREFGLPVAEASVEQFEDTKALAVKRFDKELAKNTSWIIRHPTEAMCQATGTAPALKYEGDGGPGVLTIMDLLKSSVKAENDRKQFIKSVFLFWLLGAIDGHAKNFSIFLRQGGRFDLTPLYDVISAYPLAEKRQIEYRDMNMAMALHGSKTHYKWYSIMPRHWFNESRRVGFPETEMQSIIDDTLSKIEDVIFCRIITFTSRFSRPHCFSSI